jgi:pSer/pThr/pTyr-binding forkhead associated (FHA) protein
MAGTVKLTVLRGPHKGLRFNFRSRASCVVGRADDCHVRLAHYERDSWISRHHCQLDIAPPLVRLRDLGSRNGTYLNGRNIKDEATPAGSRSSPNGTPFVTVEDTDIITIGGTPIQVHIVDSRAEVK